LTRPGIAPVCTPSWASGSASGTRRPVRTSATAPRTTSAFAERTVVKAVQAVRIPDDIPLESAALIGGGVLTGVGAVLNRARVAPGDTVVVIGTGGVQVFPRLVAAEHRFGFAGTALPSGIAELDRLLGGGLTAGSSTLVIGPAGTGKSLLLLQFLAASVARGERAGLFVFDEELGLLFSRAKSLGIDLDAMRQDNMLFVEQLDAAEISPGEFSHRVRRCVDQENIRTVAIDSLNGYQAAMPEEQFLILHLHELLQYLNRRGVATLLTVAQHGMMGDMRQPVDLTYLADAVMLLRYFEAMGRVRRAISVIKKRTGSHEDTIRELMIGNQGITVGEPLVEFQGVLRGIPTYLGNKAPLMENP
jgi:circadian clock protein KaiC